MKKSLKSKLIVFSTILVLIPLISLGIGSYIKTKTIIASDLQELSTSTLNGIKTSIDTYLVGYEHTLSMMCQDSNLKEIIDHPDYKPFLDETLKGFIESHKDVLTISFITASKVTYEYPERSASDGKDLTQKSWYKNAAENKDTVWSQPYVDGYTGKMIVTASTPVYNENKLVGVLCFDISLETLSNVTNSFKIGKDGYAYLIDGTGKIMTHKSSEFIGKEHSSEKIRQLLKTQKGGSTNYVNNENKNRFATFETLDTVDWKIFGTLYSDEIQTRSYTMLLTALIIGLISLGIAIPISYKYVTNITNHINSLLNNMSYISNGDLTVKSNIKSGDELENLSDGFNSTVDSLVSLMNNIQNVSLKVKDASENLAATAEETNATSEEITTNIEEIACGALNQAKYLEHSSTLTNNFSVKITELNNNIKDMQSSALSVVDANVEGFKTLKNLKEKTSKNNKVTYSIEKSILDLYQKSQDIENILSTISAIANQTNLLALNASIEAARAGEHGKGFAVVANEIRSLAEGSKMATDEIQNIIKTIQDNTKNTVDIMNELKSVSTEQDSAVKFVNVSFDKISESIDLISNKISIVTNFISEINSEKENLLVAIKDISSVSEETASSSQEINDSMQQQANAVESVAALATSLNELAIMLNNEIDNFKI